jgi:hypothetical protein
LFRIEVIAMPATLSINIVDALNNLSSFPPNEVFELGTTLQSLIQTAPDFDYRTTLFEDFLAGTANGNNNFTSTTAGGGTVAVTTDVAQLAGAMGASTLTAAAVNAEAGSRLGRFAVGLGGGAIVVEWRVQLPLLPTAGEDFTFRCGLNNVDLFTAPPEAFQFLLDRSVNGDNWIAQAIVGGVSVSANTTTPAVAGTFVKLRVEIDAVADVAVFLVDGVQVASLSLTSLPARTQTTRCGPAAQVKKLVGTTAREAVLDWCIFVRDLQR